LPGNSFTLRHYI